MSNVSDNYTMTCVHHSPPLIVATARQMFGAPTPQYLNALTIATNQAIADTGATSIFTMDGLDIFKKRVARKPLTINLPDGKQIMSTHICDIIIPGLPTVLTGHIVPSLRVASLIGICLLCKAGCTVIFDIQKCNVIFNGDVILKGYKDPVTHIWMLPFPTRVCTAPGPNVLPQPGLCTGCAPHPLRDVSDAHPDLTLATFTHSVRTRANAVKFPHQLLCYPKIPTLLKAFRKGSSKGVQK